MKLIYLTSLFYPSTVANNRQTLSMAKEFSDLLGNDFLFVISHTTDKDLFSGINYRETKVNLLRRLRLVSIYYFFWLPFFVKRFKAENVVLYFKDSILASAAIRLKKLFHFKYKVAFESHLLFDNWRDKYIFENADFIFPITQNLKKIILEKFGVAEFRVLVMPDGVDIDLFNIPDQKEEYRRKLNLPFDKKIIGYVGTFSTMGHDKGVRDLISAFAKLRQKNKNIFLLLAGGRNEVGVYDKFAQEKSLRGGSDFMIEKYVDYSLIPKYLKSCDVLISPFPFTRHFAYFMSPLKIFEYMASKRPIITSDLPSIREVLTENEAIFFKPGDIEDLSEKISLILRQPETYRSMAEAAFEKVKNYTWNNRAKSIWQFIK